MVRSTMAAAILTFGTLCPAAYGQGEAKEIIEKAIKAYGGQERLAKMQASQFKTKGSIDILGGITFDQSASIQYPDKIKETTAMAVMGQNISVTSIFDGTKGWIKVSDMVMDMDDKVLQAMKNAMYAMRISQRVFLLKNDKEFEISPLGEVKVNDRPALGIKISSKGQKDINMYFDKETGLMAKFEHRTIDAMSGEEIAEERIILDYQEVDGLKVPKKVMVNREGKKFLEAEVVEMKFVDKLDDGEFAKP
jgi:hypothetical protein